MASCAEVGWSVPGPLVPEIAGGQSPRQRAREARGRPRHRARPLSASDVFLLRADSPLAVPRRMQALYQRFAAGRVSRKPKKAQ
jgi:hypothetical protein